MQVCRSTAAHPQSPLLNIPIDMLLEVANHLPLDALYQLHLTNHELHGLIGPLFHKGLLQRDHGSYLSTEAASQNRQNSRKGADNPLSSESLGLIFLNACASHNITLVEYFLEHQTYNPNQDLPYPRSTDLINYRDHHDDTTPLMAAIRGYGCGKSALLSTGDLKPSFPRRTDSDHRRAVIRKLLIMGADPSFIDDNNKTALHYAAEACDIETIYLLLSCGADREAQKRVALLKDESKIRDEWMVSEMAVERQQVVQRERGRELQVENEQLPDV